MGLPLLVDAPCLLMREEVSLAAKWWTEQIQHRSTDSKSFDSKKNIFEDTLAALLTKRYKAYWFTEDPSRASGLRAIVNDLRCDPALVDAAKAAGIVSIEERLPQNTRMFVNPGSVSVREGEDDSVVLHTCNRSDGSGYTKSTWQQPGEWQPSQQQQNQEQQAQQQAQQSQQQQEFHVDPASGQQYTTQFLSDVKYGAYSSLGNGRFAVRNENGQYEICTDPSQHSSSGNAMQQRLLKVA